MSCPSPRDVAQDHVSISGAGQMCLWRYLHFELLNSGSRFKVTFFKSLKLYQIHKKEKKNVCHERKRHLFVKHFSNKHSMFIWEMGSC